MTSGMSDPRGVNGMPVFVGEGVGDVNIFLYL